MDCIFIISVLLFVSVTAQSDFSYAVQNPEYIVGNEIVTNVPQIEIDGGVFTVKPKLSKGLSLDPLTGEIKGIPTEEYQATFTITYTKTDQSKLTSVLDVKIWDKPQVLSCGFTKMDIIYNLTDSFQCKSDRKVKSWSISFDPEGAYNIAISTDGVLQFNNYNPIEKLTIKIKASNPASDEVTPISIIISKKAFEYVSGLNIDVNDVNSFYCGSGEINTVYYSLSTIIDNFDGLDTNAAYDVWDKKLNGFLSSNNVKFWNFTIEGLIYADLDGEYSFETNSDYSSYEVYIDDENVFTSDNFRYIDTDWFGDEYEYFGYCSLWDYSEKSHKVTLTSGYHNFKMIGFYSQNQIHCYFEEMYDGSEEEYCSYYYTDSTYRLKFKWIKPDGSYEDRIPFYQAKEPYKPVTYLIFDSNYYTVPVNTYFEIPFKFERGKATECAGPPSTITFDMNKNIMKGSLAFAFAMPVNVFCKTSTSTTNTVSITIKGVNQYVKGIVGYYLKSNNFDDSCSVPYTPSTDNVNTEMIRLEDGINHPYQSEYYLWDGLTPNFMSEFGVNWEGYIKIDINDNYTFNLTSVQASWLSIDYVEIINHKDVNDWSSVNKTINLSVGYHFIRVNYMKYIGASGIILTMKQGENGEYKEMNDYLYFIPRGDFEYSTSYAVYIKNKQIDNNIPRIHEGGSISECTSNPTLPSDLELIDDCTIRGTPKVESDRQSYTITGKMSDGKTASATIQISVIGSITPQGIHLIDLDNIGIIYTDSVNLLLGNETHFSIDVESGYVLYYEFENTPEGFDLNTFTGTLTIIGREILTNYELVIKAYYDKNENPISKTIIVNVTNGCLGEGEEVVFFKVDNDLNPRERYIDYKYKNEYNNILFILTIPPGPVPLYSQSVCLIPGNYVIELIDQYPVGSSGYNYISLYSNGRLVDYLTLENGDSKHIPINTELKGPTVEYGKIKTVYYLNDIVSLIPQTKLLERCEISPELPSCLSFNISTCAITGQATELLSETQYTITAIGLYLKTTKHINLTLYNETVSSICNKQYKALISVYLLTSNERYVNPEDFIYRLYRTSEYDFDNRTALIELKGSKEGWIEDTEYEYYYCLEEDEYTSEYLNTETYNAGFKSSYFDISVNDIPVTRKSLDTSELEGTNHFNAISDYNYKTEWEYSSRYEDGWDEIDKASGLWEKTKLPEIENIAGNVVYIRKIDTFTNLDQYSAFSLKIRYVSGIIVKINGKEIYRDNLPKGEITPSTMAETMYNALLDKVFLLPLDWFVEEKVIITIELHKHENEKNFPQIISTLLKMIGTEGECLILNKFARPITETNTKASSGYEIKLAFDEISYTECYTSLGWTIMRFKEGINAYFNQFSINVYDNTEDYPEDFSIEGYNSNNNTWNTIVNYKGITFPENKRRVFTNYDMSNMYTALRINMTGYNENSSHIDLFDFNFHLCPFRYCKAVDDLLPDTPTGTEVKVSCKNPSIHGERTFYCGNDKKWEEVNTTCEEEPTVLFQETEYTFKAGSSYKDISLFKISGKNISYSMNPIIEGLEIDKKTGLISGKPYKEQNEQFIYFLFSSPFSPNPVTIEIKITVLPSERPILIWINDTITLDSGKNYNDLRLFYVTGINITYTVDELPSGLYLDKNTGLINGVTVEESSIKCTIMAKNQYELEFALLINVVLPYKPNNVKYEKEVSVIFGVNYIDLQPYKCVAKTLTYSVYPKLPEGLVLNETTGVISGKVNVEPPSSQSYTFNCSNYYGEIPNPITIHIEESVEPVIIKHIDKITIEGGKDYDGITLGRVTGKNLLYKITPSLPSTTLKLNTSTGTISGYISEKFNSVNLTMTISGSGKQVFYSFIMDSSIPDYPVIVPSTKVSNITFDFSQPIKNIYLFVVVGTNIFISVKPELPDGLTLVHETGEIYGIPVKYVEETKYVFSITNIPSPIIETVEVVIKFNAIYCEANSGFPKTPAEKGGREVSIKCGGANSGMKRRKCLLTDGNKAVWSKIDDSECKISSGAIAGIAVGSVAAGLIIIIVIAFCLLRTGIFRKRARSQSQLHKIIVDSTDKDIPGNNVQDKGVRV